MTKSGDVDPLFDVRNSFYFGSYQKCINTAQELHLKSAQDSLAKAYMYRAYIAQNKTSLVLNEIDHQNEVPALKAVRRFADYMAHPARRIAIVKEMEEEMVDGYYPSCDDTVCLMAAMVYLHEQKIEDALKVLHYSDSLECQALTVECLLQLNRVDLALKEIKKMQEIDEDAMVTQIALAWTNLAAGKEKLKDAFYIFQEIIDKYGATPLLLVAQSSCLIQQQKYSDAEKLLSEAQQRDPNCAEALINLVAVSQFLGKPLEVTNRYINQLKEGHPKHPWTMDYLAKEKMFEKIALELD